MSNNFFVDFMSSVIAMDSVLSWNSLWIGQYIVKELSRICELFFQDGKNKTLLTMFIQQIKKISSCWKKGGIFLGEFLVTEGCGREKVKRKSLVLHFEWYIFFLIF